MEIKNLYFIVNPVSAAGKCFERFKEAERYLSRHGIKGKALLTEHSGHGVELSKQALSEGADCIVVVGGDGSIREVSSEIIGTDTKFCIFPFGSGNDFAKAIEIPDEPEKAAEQLISGSVHEIDAASVNGVPFMNVAGFGFDVEVLVQTEKYKKRMGGKTSYMFGLIEALTHLKAHKIRYTVDGKIKEEKALIASVGNGKYIGGGMCIHPNAIADDGLLEVCIVKDMKKRKILPALMKLLKGKHLALPVVEYFRTTEIDIECDDEMIVQLDGELIEKTPASFKIIPKGIKLIK